MVKKILISTGGSGGHVVPGIIFYEHLKNKFDVFISSDRRGAQFIDKKKYNIEIINTPKLSKNLFLIPFQLISIIYLVIKSYFFLRKKKIDILISTGGYMSLPLCVASKILNIKIFLFEPNMILGRANRLFLNFCEKIFCYSSEIKKFSNKFLDKIVIIKTLLRKEFYLTNLSMNIDKEINLLIIGGSQGAKLFDTAISDSIIKISKKYKLKILQQSNFKNYHQLKNFYLQHNIENELFDFKENISDYMSRSNLCITRGRCINISRINFFKLTIFGSSICFSKR